MARIQNSQVTKKPGDEKHRGEERGKDSWCSRSATDQLYCESMIKSMPVGVVALSPDLHIVEFSPWAEKLTGYSCSDVIGHSCGDVLRGGMCNIDCPLKAVINQLKPFVQLETTIRDREGRIIPVRMGTAGIFDMNGKLIGGVETFMDITDLKNLERQRANIISMFAHDMRSSLTGIHGIGLRLLRHVDEVDVETRRKSLEILTREAAKLESLVDDFLEFSRLETGTMKLHFSATSLDSVLEELFELYRGKAAEKGIELTLQIGEILPVIEADVQRLRRVFTNLLDNALKFSPVGRTVAIVAHETDREIVISIKDKGVGIEAEDLPHVFEIFYRGSTPSGKEGHGLGLATVKAIVEGHGGRIIVASDPGEGATFTVFLPK